MLLLSIPAFLNVIAAFSAFFTDIVYSYNDANEFVRGALGYTTHVVLIFYMICILVVYMKRGRNHVLLENAIIIGSVIVTMAAMIIEAVTPLHGIGRTAIVLSTIAYYIFFQTRTYQDDIRDYLEQAIRAQREHLREVNIIGVLANEYVTVCYVDVEKNLVTPYRMDKTIDERYGDILRSGVTFEQIFQTYVFQEICETEDKLKAMGNQPDQLEKQIRELAEARFAELGLPKEVLDKHAVELSGGMKQRTVIAVSTILNPKVLIADEPSSALDVTSQKMVIKMMRQLMEKGYIKAMLFITHELPLLYNVTDDIMVMYAGQIVERGSAKEMVFDPMHPYSHGLMNSILVPEEGTRGNKLTAIPGTPPNLKRPPKGCRFAERCKYARPECHYTAPPQKPFDDGRMYRCLMGLEELKEVYSHE